MPDTSRGKNVRLSDGTVLKIEYHENVESTVAIAREYAKAGYPDRYIIVSERQKDTGLIGGRRQKEGEYAKGIFISCILKPPFFPAQAALISHLCAVSLLSALEEHTTKKLGLGWITDIYCDGKKIGGVAIEGKLTSYSAYEYMIITLAVQLEEKNFPPRLSDMVRKVFGSGEERSIPMIITKTILEKMFAAYASVRNPGKYMDLYKRKFVLYGKKVKYLSPEGRKAVKAIDVNKESGTLIIEKKRGEQIEVRSASMISTPKGLSVS